MKDIKQYILNRNREQSDLFCSSDARLARQLYRAQHPTEIAAFKCMDGRLNLSVMTQTPPGIIQPFRNIGGRFHLGWPFLGETVKDWVNYGVSKGRPSLIFVSYHFSRGDNHRGCAGFKYNTDEARASAFNLREQFERVYGAKHSVVYPIVVGIETDEDALVFHSGKGEMDVAKVTEASSEQLEQHLRNLYGDMTPVMRRDLLELVVGNQRHVREVRQTNRQPIDLDHREQIIAVGRGFDWLHLPNKALIVGPYSHAWPSAVETAARIVHSNIEAGRVSADADVLLLVSAFTRDEKDSAGWNTAVEKAKYLNQVAAEVIRTTQPDVAKRLVMLTGVVDAETRFLHRVDDEHNVFEFPRSVSHTHSHEEHVEPMRAQG